MASSQNYEHICRYYNLPARKHAPVKYKGRLAVVVAADGQYVKLKFDGEAKPDRGRYHPTWEMEWLEKESEVTL